MEQETPIPGNVPLSERARQAIEFSFAEAKRLGSEEVTPEHLLLGLIREQRALPAKLPSHARARRMLSTCSVVRMHHLIRTEEPKQRNWRRKPARRADGWLFRLFETIQNDIF